MSGIHRQAVSAVGRQVSMRLVTDRDNTAVRIEVKRDDEQRERQELYLSTAEAGVLLGMLDNVLLIRRYRDNPVESLEHWQKLRDERERRLGGEEAAE